MCSALNVRIVSVLWNSTDVLSSERQDLPNARGMGHQLYFVIVVCGRLLLVSSVTFAMTSISFWMMGPPKNECSVFTSVKSIFYLCRLLGLAPVTFTEKRLSYLNMELRIVIKDPSMFNIYSHLSKPAFKLYSSQINPDLMPHSSLHTDETVTTCGSTNSNSLVLSGLRRLREAHDVLNDAVELLVKTFDIQILLFVVVSLFCLISQNVAEPASSGVGIASLNKANSAIHNMESVEEPLLLLVLLQRYRRRKSPRFWVHPIVGVRLQFGRTIGELLPCCLKFIPQLTGIPDVKISFTKDLTHVCPYNFEWVHITAAWRPCNNINVLPTICKPTLH
ncbi:unnamed protein product [Timema podura]|uniref:Uncharacterized protein n=1 Tax=Timema podura TaxID=61482 RepID=A0ABN7NER1_TIMPD|nr:unnamed protein product [Timema podura]